MSSSSGPLAWEPFNQGKEMKTRKRPGPARSKQATTRERLIDAAAEVFNTVGYGGTDSNRLARAAGYAPATFYKHFEDKRAIFLAAYERWVLTEWEAIRSELDGSHFGPRALSRVTRKVLEHHRRWAGFRRDLRALAGSDDVVREFRIGQRRDQLAFVGELSRRAGGRAGSPSERLYLLLVFERVCDAIADGEAEALGVSEASLLRLLRGSIESIQSR